MFFSHLHLKYVAYYLIILTLHAFLTLSLSSYYTLEMIDGTMTLWVCLGDRLRSFSLSLYVGKVTDRIIMEMQLVPPSLAPFSKSVCVTKFTNVLISNFW